MAYVRLGAVRTWFEEQGDGEPLVLLHGGMSDSRTFGAGVPLFAKQFRTFTVDRRGHGRTPDVPGPLSYDVMAADTIAFLEQVVGAPADLVGYSDGANVALLVALRRPELVRRVVSISGNYHYDGLVPGMMDDFGGDPDSWIAKYHAEVSPDPVENFPAFVEKYNTMVHTQPTLTEQDLSGVRARTLVLSGDDDLITLEHTVSLYRGIPDSELSVVPGTSHLLVFEKPEQVYGQIIDFLTTAPVRTLLPVRRAPH
ncbi:pimeloyl-ACP methyl ester carboxylesterase [Nocardia transvalensis]|uniref:Pimeloyl-ACP methyl ester carboxylesterase n=1 Tax=Nocardia transvalensis TaxID=37333 RepID=A0A7W9PCX1_9NOCA|nr:alpha/beta hydrolase [Nocardia transvalensis]MBB5913645.1 pimeloyl-ACP methyl ester carboxylesterase [Nocardia transvalensis]